MAGGEVLHAPAGWILLPPGDPGLTRRVKAEGPCWVMSEKKGRGLLLEMMGSGDVWYEGSRSADDYIRGDCLVWLGRRRVPVTSLSCTPFFIGWDFPIDAQMTSEMVVTVARNSRKLKALYLIHWPWGFPADHMTVIASHCQDVETLDLSYFEIAGNDPLDIEFFGNYVSDTVVIAAVSGMQKLKTVIFVTCFGITNASLMALSSHCPRIVKADFCGCKEVIGGCGGDANVVRISVKLR
jgi:hypothetical protein